MAVEETLLGTAAQPYSTSLALAWLPKLPLALRPATTDASVAHAAWHTQARPKGSDLLRLRRGPSASRKVEAAAGEGSGGGPASTALQSASYGGTVSRNPENSPFPVLPCSRLKAGCAVHGAPSCGYDCSSEKLKNDDLTSNLKFHGHTGTESLQSRSLLVVEEPWCPEIRP